MTAEDLKIVAFLILAFGVVCTPTFGLIVYSPPPSRIKLQCFLLFATAIVAAFVFGIIQAVMSGYLNLNALPRSSTRWVELVAGISILALPLTCLAAIPIWVTIVINGHRYRKARIKQLSCVTGSETLKDDIKSGAEGE